METNSYNFIIKYDGPALSDNTIDVTHLAPALLSLSEAINGLNAIANKDEAKVALKVKALNKGCFIIDFVLNQNLIAQVGALLTGCGIGAYCNAYTLIRSLIDLLELKRWLAGKAPEKIIDNTGNNVTYVLGNQSYTVNIYTHAGYQNQTINAACSKVVAPVKNEGINSVSFESGDETHTFTKSDLSAISATPKDVVLSQNSVTCIIIIETVCFKDGSKWKVKRGEKDSIFVTISDSAFLQKIDTGNERFGKGDFLRVELEETQTLSEGKIISTYDVKKVLEHKTSAEQFALF